MIIPSPGHLWNQADGNPGEYRRLLRFQARYNGECDGCGYEFQAGDSIRSDGAGGWLCGECGEGK